ncbi:hypothetical protein [Chryseobacterium sp.]|uniref:hypothetical protein n=1 Tax=Chryseobacterium sp. TaxID=1871047 RepID=UPI0025BD3C2E|nr:hypothetical protein [Chryseobacterium sp.]
MPYTVISVFPASVDVEEVKKDLLNHGFDESDVIVSKSKLHEGSSSENYEEDEKTKSFWDFLFVKKGELLSAYSKESVGNHDVVVYTDSLEEAQKAKTFLNEKGAIEVYKKQPESSEEKTVADLPEDVYNGIIAKARHSVYFLDPERVYKPNSRGMDRVMDSLGSKD